VTGSSIALQVNYGVLRMYAGRGRGFIPPNQLQMTGYPTNSEAPQLQPVDRGWGQNRYPPYTQNQYPTRRYEEEKVERERLEKLKKLEKEEKKREEKKKRKKEDINIIKLINKVTATNGIPTKANMNISSESSGGSTEESSSDLKKQNKKLKRKMKEMRENEVKIIGKVKE
jgi:hypothetical protein